MPNSRSIPPELWEQAREALVFYFCRRLGMSNAEDLAHETLIAVWSREDFTFERDDQFLRVCYGFASRIAQKGYREARRNAMAPLHPGLPARPSEDSGFHEIESRTFLGEVLRVSQMALKENELALVEALVTDNGAALESALTPSHLRVQTYRVREKLAKITGWIRPRRGNKV